jgi:hypothetical protein
MLPLPPVRQLQVQRSRLRVLRAWADDYTRWAYDPMPTWLRYPVQQSDRSAADKA